MRRSHPSRDEPDEPLIGMHDERNKDTRQRPSDQRARQRIATGALALVVGPSGAGKDSLINAARSALAGDNRFVFARRVVTRASHEASEDHDAIAPDAFERAAAEGAFLLSWRAHGLGYAIPRSAADALAGGAVVVANVSRGSIAEAEQLIERVTVLHVMAPVAVLARRIAARGREAEADIARRLARQAPLTAARAPVVEIVNDGDLDEAARRFAQALRSLAGR